jgi:hypothetical protein
MMVSSALAESRTTCVKSRCSASNPVSSNRSVMPMIPFMGVRISWLMFDKNSDFNREFSRAWSRASRNERSAALRGPMSVNKPIQWVTFPDSLCTGE